MKLDVLDGQAVEALAKRLGPIDILFNAAGFVHHGTIPGECSDKDWDFSFDLNVKSMHRTIKAFLPGMLEKRKGSIVNIASAVAQKVAANRYVYTATKCAVVGLTRAVPSISSARACAATASARAPSRRRRWAIASRRWARRWAVSTRRGACSSSASRWAGSGPRRRWRRSRSISPPTSHVLHPTGSAIVADGGFTL